MPDELISKEGAIDALADYIHNVDKVMGTGHLTEDDCKDAATSVFEELPSAQPTQNERVNSNNPLDCISRQAAIDALAKFVPYAICDESTESYTNGLTDAYNLILQLPSAQPERKKGKWIVRDNPGTGWYRVTCSECGEDVTSTAPVIGFFPEAKVLWDYCPYCGSFNGGEE